MSRRGLGLTADEHKSEAAKILKLARKSALKASEHMRKGNCRSAFSEIVYLEEVVGVASANIGAQSGLVTNPPKRQLVAFSRIKDVTAGTRRKFVKACVR